MNLGKLNGEFACKPRLQATTVTNRCKLANEGGSGVGTIPNIFFMSYFPSCDGRHTGPDEKRQESGVERIPPKGRLAVLAKIGTPADRGAIVSYGRP